MEEPSVSVEPEDNSWHPKRIISESCQIFEHLPWSRWVWVGKTHLSSPGINDFCKDSTILFETAFFLWIRNYEKRKPFILKDVHASIYIYIFWRNHSTFYKWHFPTNPLRFNYCPLEKNSSKVSGKAGGLRVCRFHSHSMRKVNYEALYFMVCNLP